MAESKINIVPLKEGNYATWKLQCQMMLMKESLWSIVNGTDTGPAEGAEAREVEKFRIRKDRALATIVLAVDPSLLYLLDKTDDPVYVWKKLQSQFQRKNWANRLVLRRRLYSLQLKEGESVQKHVKEITELFNELSVIGETMDDEDRVVHLLASLPESFSTLVTALEASEKVPSMEIVIDRLMYEEKKSRARQEELTSEGALAVRHKYKPKPRNSIKCFNCGKVGHMQRDCFERKRAEPVKPSKFKPQQPKSVFKRKTDQEGTIGLIASAHALSVSDSVSNVDWIIDSGATCHICCNQSLFSSIEDLDEPLAVTLGDGNNIEAKQCGTVNVELKQTDGSYKPATLYDVLLVPQLSYNLLSVTRATELGNTFQFDEPTCQIINGSDEIVGSGTKRGNLYFLDCRYVSVRENHETTSINAATTSMVNQKKVGIEVWHQRYGHLNIGSLKKLARKNLVDGFNVTDINEELDLCEPCINGKIHRSPFPRVGRRRAVKPLELIHSDLCGKMNTKSLGQGEYFLTFTDDKTGYVWVYVLKQKNQVFKYFREWRSMVERTSGHKVITLRTDNGGEYVSTEFTTYLKEAGINHQLTIPRNPEQNGVAERLNRTLVESVRSMLAETTLPQHFWAEALATAVYLKNRSPIASAESETTPHESLYGKKPTVHHLKVFGCVAYSHIPKEERKKLDCKAKRCVFLGYGENVKGYRLYNPTNRKILFSRDVIFNERKFGLQEESSSTATDSPLTTEPVRLEDGIESSCQSDHDDGKESEHESEDNSPITTTSDVRRSDRNKKIPDRYGVWVNATTTGRYPVEPENFSEALTSPEKDEWRNAMNKELLSLKTNDVFDLVKLPENKKAIGCRWVFKRKIKEDGSVERYKARLVAQGFSQQPGRDYDETFCPVVRYESIRYVIAMASQMGMMLHQMDVTSAFLNGELEDEVYMKQPTGFTVKGKEQYVCKLKRSLYGLKQAPRCWNTTLDQHLKRMGFEQHSSDPCLYTSGQKDDLFIIAVYVDDLMLATRNEKKMDEVKESLAAQFQVKDLGELNYLLGVAVKQDHSNGSIWIGQPTYTSNILDRFGMMESKAVATPVSSSKLVQATDDDELVDKELYQSAIGSLQYLLTMTRLDIAFALSNVAKFNSNPTKDHWTAVKRIFRYLRGTQMFGLLYKRLPKEQECVGYSDSDWAGDLNDRKSTSGYVFTVGGGAISWKSKKQSCVALSTAEAEYIALSQAAQEAVWLRSLYVNLKLEMTAPTVVYEDNQSAICIAKNPQSHGRSKHIDIKYHFIREQVQQKTIEVKYCKTEDMIADLLTKGLGKEKFEKLRSMTGLTELNRYK